MELRKDPITQSWVIQEEGNGEWPEPEGCPLCPGHEEACLPAVYEYPFGEADWQVRVIPHLWPLYRIEGEVHRRGEGMYDKMRSLGAHEIVIEHPDHNLPLSRQPDEHVAQVLRAYGWRMAELKKDPRFRYVTVFRNQGSRAGQDLDHPHSQITATPFIPRRVIYELRSAERHFKLKERCLFCDILQQELKQQVRTVEWDDRFAAFCPFASRAPYETWIMPIGHHCSFEEDIATWDRQLRLARFLKSVLRRLETLAPEFHLILHSSPNVAARFGRKGHWRSLAEDFHWHFEIVPVLQLKAKSHSLKEVYYNSVLPELAAEELRKAAVEVEVTD
jgi:UDPglucose--hexose-1-phosphate uridylyltransferase